MMKGLPVLLKNTGLFDGASEIQFNAILENLSITNYQKGDLVFTEGDIPDALYIIAEGSVLIFSYDMHKQKICLAKLFNGDFFGEQAIIGQSNRVRNASVEAIENTTLIKIHAESVLPLWKENEKLKIKLKKIGSDEAIHLLTATVNLYDDIKLLIKHIQMTADNIVEYPDGETIFNLGDTPGNVYLILQGEVDLIVVDKKTKVQTHLVLHRGHLFGELGVIENKPRQATAIARNNLRVFIINGDKFKELYHNNMQLQSFLSELKMYYKLPLRGSVDQYVVSSDTIGLTITNIYKMDDGREIIAARLQSRKIFTMSVTSMIPEISYQYSEGLDSFIRLYVTNGRLSGIQSSGDWESLPLLCEILLDCKKLDDSTIDLFLSSGDVGLGKQAFKSNIICNCMSVTKDTLQLLISKGFKDFDSLSKETGACTVCGSCEYKILELLGSNPWLSAIMQLATKHNDKIYSYYIKPFNGKIKAFLPGQYITVQAKVDNNWVERNYTLSDIQLHDYDALRITIKNEPNGLLSRWLFADAPEQIVVSITQPKGNFTLNEGTSGDAICFAGGVGITPFISYAKNLMLKNNSKRLYILYCALTDEDFIFRDEFKEVMRKMPSITVAYRETSREGLLEANDIIGLVNSLNDPEIYICGPEGFENIIFNALQTINFDKAKIHTEKFFI